MSDLHDTPNPLNPNGGAANQPPITTGRLLGQVAWRTALVSVVGATVAGALAGLLLASAIFAAILGVGGANSESLTLAIYLPVGAGIGAASGLLYGIVVSVIGVPAMMLASLTLTPYRSRRFTLIVPRLVLGALAFIPMVVSMFMILSTRTSDSQELIWGQLFVFGVATGIGMAIALAFGSFVTKWYVRTQEATIR